MVLQMWSEFSNSSTSRSGATSNVLCSCGRIAVVRTMKSGPNVGFKFHGCPNWPWIDENNKQLGDDGVDELRYQLCKLEDEKQMADEKNKKLQLKKENLEELIKDMKSKLRHTRIELMKANRNEKI
ncbi:DNA topoisomerase 3-alpha [Bienertia sinuspersici]